MATDTVIVPECDSAARKVSFVPTVTPLAPFTAIIFGATGDLSARKLFPALYRLWRCRFFPDKFAIVGVGRRDKNHDAFRADVDKSLSAFRSDSSQPIDRSFLGNVFYHRADFTTTEGMKGLGRDIQLLEKEQKLPGNRLFYLATDPEFFSPIIAGLSAAGLVSPYQPEAQARKTWARVVIEKPFGHDLASALKLDQYIQQYLRKDQIYRIDHYLGKETVQNLLAFRFGNAIFEPLFNRQYVDHIQISMAETVGMEGRRGAFYDHAGALRDVVQNHLLQLLAIIAMDPPATLKACDVDGAKVKVLRNLLPLRGSDVAQKVVRAQYGPGTVEGQQVPGYRAEEAIAPNSTTETYVALRTEIESWRWAGVPFLLRTGKRLPRRTTEIAVQFKLPPLRLFRTVECVGDFCDLTDAHPTVLLFRIQPNEGISLTFSAKRPGMQLDLHPVRFEFDYGGAFQQTLPEAYERLLLDALRGDSTLFMHSDELQAAWEFVTPILEAWQDGSAPELATYPAGTWGPKEAERLTDDLTGGWRGL